MIQLVGGSRMQVMTGRTAGGVFVDGVDIKDLNLT